MTQALSLRDRFLLPDRPVADFRSALTAERTRDGGPRPELRQAPLEVQDVSGRKVKFRAVVFDSPSVDMGGWREVIKRGAFRKILATNPDVRFLVNHEGLPLARTTNRTLELVERPEGLDGVAELSDTQASRDFIVAVERGDITQMSFLFLAAVGGAVWTYNEGDDFETRWVSEVGWLGEVSGVTFPAYELTELAVSRSHNPSPALDGSPQEGGADRDQAPADAAEAPATDQSETPDVAGAAPVWDAAAKRRRLHLRERG